MEASHFVADHNPSKPSGSKDQTTPFQMLKTKVYPVINDVILKLIDHIVKSQEVTKHQQRLKKKKIIDQLQKKYLQRDIQKEEMGSDYEESDDQQLHKGLGMTKEAVESLVRHRIAKHKSHILEQDSDTEIDQNVFNPIDFIITELKAYQIQQGKK